MKDVNKVILIGRLGANPVLRETKSGFSVVHFPLATSRRVQSNEKEGELMEETQWHRVVTWGKQGEICAQHLKKGSSVFIEGSMRSHKYEAKDGQSRMAFEVHAENVSFLGAPKMHASETSEALAH